MVPFLLPLVSSGQQDEARQASEYKALLPVVEQHTVEHLNACLVVGKVHLCLHPPPSRTCYKL